MADSDLYAKLVAVDQRVQAVYQRIGTPSPAQMTIYKEKETLALTILADGAADRDLGLIAADIEAAGGDIEAAAAGIATAAGQFRAAVAPLEKLRLTTKRALRNAETPEAAQDAIEGFQAALHAIVMDSAGLYGL